MPHIYSGLLNCLTSSSESSMLISRYKLLRIYSEDKTLGMLDWMLAVSLIV